MRRWMLGSFVTLALMTSACGGDDDEKADKDEESEGSGTRAEYVEAFTPGMASMGVTEEQATCVAEAAVDTVGVDKLNEVTTPAEIEDQTSSFDLSALGLSEEQGGALYDKMDTCVDVFELMLGQGVDPATADCMRQNVSEDMLRAAMVAVFTSPDGATGEEAAGLSTAYNTCAAAAPPTTTPTPPSTP